jgi:hypothetical protein
MVALLDNQPGPWGDNGPVGEEQHTANRFTVTAPFDAESFEWECLVANNAAYKPARLTLWNATDDLVVSTVNDVVTPTTTGRKLVALPAPVTLVTGKTYEVSWGGSGGTAYHRPLIGSASAVDLPAPFQWANPKGGFNTTYNVDKSGTLAFITGCGITGEEAIIPPGNPPAGEPNPGTLNPSGSLAYWLHRDTVNPDSLPKITQELLADLVADETTRDAYYAALLGTASSSTTATVMGRLAALLPLVASVASIAADVVDIASFFTGATCTIDDLCVKLDNVYQSLTTEVGRRRVSILDPAWVARETLVGAGNAIWDEPADRYVLTLTGWGALRKWTPIAGVDMFGYRGSATGITEDLLSHYFPLVGKKHIIYESGERFQGLLLNLDGDLEWTLEAYDYVPTL